MLQGVDPLIIGVLDIFGFEIFDVNSFEQLCINYCNEKLQFHFNNHIFRVEQDHYRTEGVEVSDVEFQNNDLILELLEGFGGVLGQIDDEVSVPRGSDTGFLGKLNDKHGSHPNLKRPPSGTPNSASCFAVQHFAGVVAYNVGGFLEKNRDKLVENLSEVLQASSDPFVKDLFGGGALKQPADTGASGRKKKQQTLARIQKMMMQVQHA